MEEEVLDPVDNTEQLETIIGLLEGIDFNLQIIAEGSKMVLFYGYLVGPLFIVIMMLWWFFKQFIYKY